ncbi:hypothetical protein DHD32_01170 [Arenibacter sp. TNZ]|uniref:hypothetical protein n=1 Tax=Arenibacter TaxID=178469 RepID=UPI000CD3E0B6|nr:MULTISPECIES: hypothetical protein [Arenibacter]MCM4170074.1 hypothetical protein [Arenibacter sp. TNZ]
MVLSKEKMVVEEFVPINKYSYKSIVKKWKDDFIKRIKRESQSKKYSFGYFDAVQRSLGHRTNLDECMVSYIAFIDSNPLNGNDYFKYMDSYVKGKELNVKYFKHDINKLRSYYRKADLNKGGYNPFNIEAYKSYVLFMMLKLNGVYLIEYDISFNVKRNDHREYNPLTSIPSVLRGELPFIVKEYDIERAYPTFIDIELGISGRKTDVYSLLDKVQFNTLLNTHKGIDNSNIEKVRSQLRPIYNGRTNEVITIERFNNKGLMFRELVCYEEKAINEFVLSNGLVDYVRLHDGVFVKEEVQCENLRFGQINFSIKENIKPAIVNEITTFYSYNNKGELVTTPKKYSDFFIQENFIRISEPDNDKITIFKDTRNVVSPFNYKTDTLPYLKENINEFCTDEVENRIARDNFSAITGGYLLIPSKLLKYHSDSKEYFGLPFKNGFARYTHIDNEIRIVPYGLVDGFFAPHATQDVDFNYDGDSDASIFQLFLTMACIGKDPRKEELTNTDSKILSNFCAMFGYLCHTYKDQSFSPAIILSDEGADDSSRNGGRGKTILTKAVSYVQPTILKGGNEFDPKYTHNFADLDKSRKVYILDDVPAAFKYDDLYTNIVGGINCQRKGKAAQAITFEESPKFVITTNWSVRYDEDSNSTNRRFYEYKFSSYFNLNNRPEQVFGHTLFQDWDDIEWNRFYRFVFYCVGLYMNEGLQRIEYDKVEDNFRANFNSDVVLDEFERIFNLIKNDTEGFTVGRFLELYKHHENPLKFEGYFHKNNVKGLINTYINHNKLPYCYSKGDRKWMKGI